MITIELTDEELSIVKAAVITNRCEFQMQFPVAFKGVKELHMQLEKKLKEARKP